MAHFAKIVDGVVTEMIVGDDDMFTTDKYVWIVGSGPVGEWVQCSYNTRNGKYTELDENRRRVVSEDQSKALRKNYPAVGWHYDGTGFYAPKPENCDSWELDTDTYQYRAPTPYPNGGDRYKWSEEDYTSGGDGWVLDPQDSWTGEHEDPDAFFSGE
jgi:hypothetical protein